jgi:hypothetical protein
LRTSNPQQRLPIAITHSLTAVGMGYLEFIDLDSGAVITILAFF